MILGIDSAPNVTGWALVEKNTGDKERVVQSGRLTTVTGSVVRRFVEHWAAHRDRIEMTVIEDAFYGNNVSVVKSLCRLIGRWEQEFDRAGMPTRLVLAQVWQRGILSGLLGKAAARRSRKLASQIWVQATYGLVVGEDESEAIGIATWEARHRYMAARAGVPVKTVRRLS